MRGLLLAAPASGQGKTTITLGLLRALVQRGHSVCSAKSGPDFIDPAFHAFATGHPCLTLDPWAASPDQLRARVEAATADLTVIEGAMGLWDGAATDFVEIGTGSSAALARALNVPVVLIVDVARMGQSIAPLLHGYVSYGRDVEIAGVILNRVGSARHENIVRRAAETVCTVLGCVPRDTALATPSRHLGLVQAEERDDLETFINCAAEIVGGSCDLEALAGAAGTVSAARSEIQSLPVLGQRIAVARDLAFAFVYEHMLTDWREQGAEITFFSPLADEGPETGSDAVFLPGGYPELFAGKLSGADRFRAAMSASVASGAMVYGECGGYMVLGNSLTDADGQDHPMLDLLPVATSFAEPERTLGYRAISVANGPLAGIYRGHEFHYSREVSSGGERFGSASDAAGIDLGPIGSRIGRVSGSYMHLIERA